MRRMMAALVLTLVLLARPVTGVDSAAEWCEYDPLIAIVTPGGSVVPVFVTNGALGAEHGPSAQIAAMGYRVKAVAAGRATMVELTVVVPDDPFGSGFPTRSTASSGPLKTGTVHAQTDGVSGGGMVLRFTLDVP